MADLSELHSALIAADKAGDTDAAKSLAAEIIRMQGGEAQPSEAAPAQAPSNIVTPDPMQKRMGIRKPRVKDDNFGSHVLGAFNDAGYDVGGGVTDMAAKILPPGGAAALGYAANVATDTVPSLIGGGVSKVPMVAEAAQGAGRRVMQSALKPTWEALKTGKAAQAIDTMLEGGFNATKGGVEAMKTKIGQLNDEIAAALENHPGVIEPYKVAERVKELAEKFKMQVTPQADVATIKNAMNDFLNHPLLRDMAEIPVKTAQALKQGTYKSLGSKSYGELKGAEVEAQKALARGLKEEISATVPGVAEKNAAESQLINASNIAERRAMLQDNNNLGGLVWLAHDPVAAVGFMADKSALAQSLFASGMYSGGIPQAGGQAAGGLLGAMTAFPPNEGILSRRTAWMGEGAK